MTPDDNETRDDLLDDEYSDDDDLDDEDEDEDEETSKAIMTALMEAFEEECEGADPLVAMHAVLNFTVTVTHMLLYDVVDFAREEKLDVQRLAEEWLINASKAFTAGVGNETLLRELGRIMERPEIGLKFNRQFRRRLAGS